MSCINKVRYLSSKDFSTTDCFNEEKELYTAAAAFLLSDEEKAERAAKKLYESTMNEELKEAALSIIFSLLLWQNRFDELSEFGIPRNENEAMAISLFDTRNVEIIYTNKNDCLNIIPSELGWAIITVQINGVDVELMVDTGAMVTTINETTATKCGIIAAETAEGSNALGDQISLAGSKVGKLAIGGSEFRNQTCMIVPDAMIDFGGYKINGTIGWDVIRLLKWIFDFKNKSVSISMPIAENVERNMICDFFPMVRLNVNGRQVNMCLDTGANKTRFGTVMKESFTDLEQYEYEHIKLGGAGSSKEEFVYTLPKVDIKIGEQNISIENIYLMSEIECSLSQFFVTPGILGVDIAKDKTLIIDYFNRHFSVK